MQRRPGSIGIIDSIGIRWVDILCLVLFVSVLTGVTVAAYASGSPVFVSIQSVDEEWLYPLDTDRTVEVPGPIGTTMIEISNKTVRVIDSPCRDRICITMGTLTQTGEWSACLPNRVLVRIIGERSDGVDALVY